MSTVWAVNSVLSEKELSEKEEVCKVTVSMDQTEFFKKCVEIYRVELDSEVLTNESINDSGNRASEIEGQQGGKKSEFLSKAASIHNTLKSLNVLLKQIRSQYLHASSKVLNEEQKIRFDTEIKVKIQQLSGRIRNMQDAEAKIINMDADSEELTVALEKIGFSIPHGKSWNVMKSLSRNLISMGDYSEFVATRNNSLRIIYSNIVKSLALMLQNTVLYWDDMHGKRVERLIELKKSTLNEVSYRSQHQTQSKQQESESISDKMIFKNDDSFTGAFKKEGNTEQYIADDYMTLKQELPQQQLLQLQKEQDTLAEELKKNSLDTVTKIEQSMIDVAGMVHEIGLQLSLQNDNIVSLDQHKDEIVGNVKSGNTVLVKANERNSQKNKTFAWAIFIAALILLTVDYIL